MDWMATNHSQQQDWVNRPKLSDYTYADIGVPVEIMVALCNKLKLHPWFCMPHMATMIMWRICLLSPDTLDPTLEIYLSSPIGLELAFSSDMVLKCRNCTLGE
jgi:hypothetical protein